VIRKCLEDARNTTGVERTVLHATREGQPVDQRMGYRRVVRFLRAVSLRIAIGFA
jgi:hypothetical protein